MRIFGAHVFSLLAKCPKNSRSISFIFGPMVQLAMNCFFFLLFDKLVASVFIITFSIAFVAASVAAAAYFLHLTNRSLFPGQLRPKAINNNQHTIVVANFLLRFLKISKCITHKLTVCNTNAHKRLYKHP